MGTWSKSESQLVTVSLPFNNYNVNPYEDLVIIDWGFNSYHMLTIENDAMQFMDNGDYIHILDNNGIITNNCDDENIYGMISIASSRYDDFITNPYNLYLNEGLNDCSESNNLFSGYVKGNQAVFLHYDLSDDNFYELEPNFTSWSGLLGDSPQDTLRFKFYDQSENKTYTINEFIPFTPDMIEGNAFIPFELTFDNNNYINGQLDCSFDYSNYEYSGSITSSIINTELGDELYAFVGNDCRGSTLSDESPFGDILFNILTYGNTALTLIDSFNQTPVVFDNFINNSNSRNQENFNIYRDGDLIDSFVNDFYYIDNDIPNQDEVCYEIVLTDDDGQELIVSMEQCIEFSSSEDILIGDINGDLMINVVDIVLLVEIIINNINNNFADINQDGFINVVDIVLLVEIIINS